MADLKGKKVAVTPGTPSHTFLLRMMSSAGLKPGDVTVVEVGGVPDAVKAFQTDRGLTVDGLVGPKTWAKLVEGGVGD